MLQYADETVRSVIEQSGTTIRVNDREFLVHEGDDERSVFFIVSGLLKVIKTSLEGKISFLGLCRPGTFVGELSFLAEGRRTSSLQAVEPSIVVRIGANTFESLLAEHADLSRALLRDLALRLRDTSEQAHNLISADAATRMASRLVQLVDGTAQDPAQAVTLELPVSQQELGEWAGLSRAGAVNALRELRTQGLIETSRMSIEIIDVARLRHAASA